jgi:hypothetical protein
VMVPVKFSLLNENKNGTGSSLYDVWYKHMNKQLYFINFELRKNILHYPSSGCLTDYCVVLKC